MFSIEQNNYLKTTFNLSKEQINLINQFSSLLLEFNKSTNLTSITNITDFFEKNIIDSLFFLKYFDIKNKNILDLGTGGGLPGIILAIASPTSNFYLMDSTIKKIIILEKIIKQLNLTNVNLISSRAEKYNSTKFDLVLSRAVSKTSILLELSCHLLKKNGQAIFFKGPFVLKELNLNHELLYESLGFEFSSKIDYVIMNKINHSFIVFSKTKDEDRNFPRNYSIIKAKNIFELSNSL